METPRVYLVGAGPGHPGYLTVRALECLASADVVIYDNLVPVRMLDQAPPAAERLCVSELAGHHVERSPLIIDKMIEEARRGKRVVRLKGGDPFVFGRGGEEAEALRQAGIAYEIVPGVTAGLGAAACAGIPLTHRNYSSGVAFVTGHEDPAKEESAIDWQAVARFPGTLVVYMGIARIEQIVASLVGNGKDAATPAAAVQWATTGEQRTVEAPLGKLADAVQSAGITSPAVLIVGPVVELRSQLAWFESRPLFGRHVLVTRPRQQSADLVGMLETLGAVTHVLPAVDIRAPADWSAADAALTHLGSFQWLVFTSSNGVHALVHRLKQLGRDLRALGSLRLAAIGPATADALRHYHLEPDVVPDEFRSEGLVAALADKVKGQRVLLARADRGRELLRDELSRGATVEQIAVYSQVDAVDRASPVFDLLQAGGIEFITLTSSNIARAVFEALNPACQQRIHAGQLKLVTISPVTSETVRALGLPVSAEAKEYTSGGVVQALLTLCAK